MRYAWIAVLADMWHESGDIGRAGLVCIAVAFAGVILWAVLTGVFGFVEFVVAAHKALERRGLSL